MRREVNELWEAFGRRENSRVPITFACDEQLWLKVSGHTFREFYAKPEVHLKAQLEGKRWFCENVIGDAPPGLPERWTVGVQHWMEENEFFGCEVVYQEDDYAWGMPLPLERNDLLRHIARIDARERIRQGSTYRMWKALGSLAEDMRYLDRPVDVAPPGGGTHGIFTKAAEVRGLEQLCLDIVEAPEFVEEFLSLATEKTVERIKAWHALTRGNEPVLPYGTGFGLADDSLQMISSEAYERFVLPCHERLYSAMTTGSRSIHLCGRSTQHYEALRWKARVTHIDGPGPFVDHAHYLEAFGPEFSFAGQTDHSVLAHGSETEIDKMMRKVLTPGAKIPGRFQILGYVTRDTPLENVRACYQAGLRHGTVRGG